MIAKRTTFAATGNTLKALEAATAAARQDGAPGDAGIWFFPLQDGYTLKAEWEVTEPDPAGPPVDTREQPTQVAPVVQPDGLINETPAH